jgi:alpha-ketoglutaric semialdehyde dehydrogenase
MTRRTRGEFRGIDAAAGEALEPTLDGATLQDLDAACAQTAAAFQLYRAL